MVFLASVFLVGFVGLWLYVVSHFGTHFASLIICISGLYLAHTTYLTVACYLIVCCIFRPIGVRIDVFSVMFLRAARDGAKPNMNCPSIIRYKYSGI